MRKVLVGASIVGGILALFFLLSSPPKHSKLLGIYDSTKSVRPTFDLEPFYSKVGIVAKRYDWEKKFPKKFVVDTLNQGSIPFIFWEPLEWYDRDLFNLNTITDGIWDDHIQKWAEDVKEFKYPVFICFAPYPDRNESTWGKKQGDDWENRYKQTYHYIKRKFVDAGAQNALWVFGITNDSFLINQSAQIDRLYPGNDVIDWVMIQAIQPLDEYHWKPLSLEATFSEGVSYFRSTFSKKPILLSGISLQNNTQLDELKHALESSLHTVNGILLEHTTIHNSLITPLVTSSIFEFNSDTLNSIPTVLPSKKLYITTEQYPKLNAITRKDLIAGSQFLSDAIPVQKGTLSLINTSDTLTIKGTIYDESHPQKRIYKEGLIENTDSVKLTLHYINSNDAYGIELRQPEPIVWNYSTFSYDKNVTVQNDGNKFSFSLHLPVKKESLKGLTCRITDSNEKGQKMVYQTQWNEVHYEVK